MNRFRPGFMPLMIGAALLLTPGVGLLANQMFDAKEYEAKVRERDGAKLRETQSQRGWHPNLPPTCTPIAKDLLRTHDVELLVADDAFHLSLANGVVQGTSPSSPAVSRGVHIVAEEMRRYPSAFFRAIRLERVLLTSELREVGLAIPSLPNVESTLLLDADAPDGFLRRLIHHEVFHFVDFADDSVVRHDSRWEGLNGALAPHGPEGDPFRYADGGRSMRAPSDAFLTDEIPGFVTRYGQAAVEEDKAELFAHLMVSPSRVHDLVMTDPVVAAKVVAIADQVGGVSLTMGETVLRLGTNP